MRFTLKDYQSDAVGQVLENLRDAQGVPCGAARGAGWAAAATRGKG